jgi:hypothetical protein
MLRHGAHRILYEIYDQLSTLYICVTTAYAEVAGLTSNEGCKKEDLGRMMIERVPTYILLVFQSSHYERKRVRQ